MTVIGIDIGYSSSKIMYNNEYFKVPTSISFAHDMGGIDFGESTIYNFEGEAYHVGESATDESFTTTDYTFLYKFAPLIIFHIIKKLNIQGPVEVRTGLALSDWTERESFRERISTININDEILNLTAILVGPQGDGAYRSYITDNNLFDQIPETFSVIDIGYRTINFLYYENGIAHQNKCKGFPGHGVVSIMKTFTNFLESEYGMNFSEQEALKIFLNGSFKIGGVQQTKVPEVINDLKNKFVIKLMNSILVSEKKILKLSDYVLITGGGSYLIEDVQMPPNTVWSTNPKEFANVRGYMLV